MRHIVFGRIFRSLATILILAASVYGQTSQDVSVPARRPREFPELRGTWILDERAGQGHIAGVPVAHTLTISTTPLEISLVKDGSDPEVYSLDGRDVSAKDARTGAVLDKRFSFTLVAGMVALTSKRIRGDFTNIITDTYGASGDTLSVSSACSYSHRAIW